MRLAKKDRTEQLLIVATSIAEKKGLNAVSRAAIAAEAGVSEALINTHYGTMTQLRRAIMRRAVKDRILTIICQGLVLNDPIAKKAPEDLRQAAANSIV